MESIKSMFIVEDGVQQEKLEVLATKALEFCVVGKNGIVHIKDDRLSAKNKIKLVLSARLLAAELDENINGEVSNDELAASTSLPANQVRARVTEVVNESFADATGRGTFKARAHKIEGFLDGL